LDQTLGHDGQRQWDRLFHGGGEYRNEHPLGDDHGSGPDVYGEPGRGGAVVFLSTESDERAVTDSSGGGIGVIQRHRWGRVHVDGDNVGKLDQTLGHVG
jgi:hypothetical protein